MVKVHMVANEVNAPDVQDLLVDQDQLPMESTPGLGGEKTDPGTKDSPFDAGGLPTVF
jgi:hypothetical protein